MEIETLIGCRRLPFPHSLRTNGLRGGHHGEVIKRGNRGSKHSKLKEASSIAEGSGGRNWFSLGIVGESDPFWRLLKVTLF